MLGALALLGALSAGDAAAKDLTVWVTAPATPENNATFEVNVTVDNDASGATGAPVEVQLYLDGSPAGPALNFGQMNSATRDFRLANLTAVCGSHTLLAVVDPSDAVAENNETNNNFTATLVVQPAVNFTHAITGDLGEHTLTLTAVTEGCAPLDYTWTLVGVEQTGSPVDYMPLAGDVEVTLTAASAADPAINHSITRVVTIPNKAPDAVVTLPDTEISTGQSLAIQVQATDADGVIASFLVEFGDGNSSASLASAFDHKYTRPDNYTVTVTVTDNLGATNVSTVDIEVSNRPPVARTPIFLAGNAGDPIRFNGSASSDPDGGPVTITWDFGDGATATSGEAEHAYADPGTYTATMTVTDEYGGTAATQITVQVSSAADPGAGWIVLVGLIIFGAALAAGYYLLTRKRREEPERPEGPDAPEAPPAADAPPGDEKPPAP